MKKTIESRFGEKRTIEKISDNQYLISGHDKWIHVGGRMTEIQLINFSGGPLIGINTDLTRFGIKANVQKIEKVEAEIPTYKLTVINKR